MAKSSQFWDGVMKTLWKRSHWNTRVSPTAADTEGSPWRPGINQSMTISFGPDDTVVETVTLTVAGGDVGEVVGGGRSVGGGGLSGQEKLEQPSDDLRTSVTLIDGALASGSSEVGSPTGSTTPTTEARKPLRAESSSPVQSRHAPRAPLRAAKLYIMSSPFGSNCAATEYKPPSRSGSPRTVYPDLTHTHRDQGGSAGCATQGPQGFGRSYYREVSHVRCKTYP